MNGDLDARPGQRVRVSSGRLGPVLVVVVSWLKRRGVVTRWAGLAAGCWVVWWNSHGGVPALIGLVRGVAARPGSVAAPAAEWARKTRLGADHQQAHDVLAAVATRTGHPDRAQRHQALAVELRTPSLAPPHRRRG